MAKNYKYITYIVIIISLGIFVSTQIFKQMSQKNYLELENLMSSLKLEETPGNEREKIREKCLPFTYFDQETYNQTEQLLIVMSNAAMTGEDIEKEVYKLQRLLNARQQKLLFSFDMLLYFSLVLVLIAMVVIVYDLLSEKNEADRIQAVNQEQLKFSRDLHDGIAQDLAALKVYLQKKDDEKSEFYATHALNEVRYLIDSMQSDFSKAFTENVAEILQNFETNYGIKSNLIIAGETLDNIKKENQMELLRLFQEALSNIARHANATEVTVQLTEVGDDLKFNIKDNGVGFDVEMLNQVQHDNHQVQHDGDGCHPELDSGSHPKKHYGIKNIKERVTALGGTVDFINNGGTTIAITIKDFIR